MDRRGIAPDEVPEQMGKRKQMAYLVLSLLLLLVIILPAVWHRWGASKEMTQDMQTDTLFANEIQRYSDSLQQLQAAHDSLVRSRRMQRYSYNNNYRSQTTTQEYRSTSGTFATEGYKREILSFELNEADTIDLQQLRGIGPTFARRIVAYRTSLGGFVSKEQLLEVYGLPPETYASIIPHLSIDTTHIHHLNVNTATLEQLKRHPYLGYYKARAIVEYRNKGHHYHQPEDLLQVYLMDDSTLQRILPYLTF